MLGRYHCMRIVLGAVVANISYKRWLDKQEPATKTKGAWVLLTVNDDDHWDGVSRAVRVLTPTLRVLRLTDGKTGATLGKVYESILFKVPCFGRSKKKVLMAL